MVDLTKLTDAQLDILEKFQSKGLNVLSDAELDELEAIQKAQAESGGTISPITNKEFEKGKPGYGKGIMDKLVHGASMGLIDDFTGIGAGVESAIAKGGAKLGLPIDEKMKKQSILDAYRSAKMGEKIRQAQAAQKLGVHAPLVDIIGGLTLPVGRATSAVNMAKIGGGIGAVEGYGRSDADLTRGEVLPLVKDIAIGTGLGGIGGYLAGMGSKLIPDKNAMYETAINQGGIKGTDLQYLDKYGKVKADLGKTIMEDAGGLRPSASGKVVRNDVTGKIDVIEPGSIHNIQNKATEVGERIKGTLSDIPQPIMADEFLAILEDVAARAKSPKLSRELRNRIKVLREERGFTPGSLKSFNDIRNEITGYIDDAGQKIDGLDDMIRYSGSNPATMSGKDTLKAARDNSSKFLDNKLEKYGALTPKQVAAYQKDRATFSNLKDAEAIFKREAFQKGESVGVDNAQTTVRKGMFDPVMDAFRYVKTGIEKPIFNITNQGVRDAVNAPMLGGQKFNAFRDYFNQKTPEELEAERIKQGL